MVIFIDRCFFHLCDRYDPDGYGYITHDQFLKEIGVNFAPGDADGVSRAIVEQSMRTLDDHHATMNFKHEQQTYNQANAAWSLSVDQIYQQLRYALH